MSSVIERIEVFRPIDESPDLSYLEDSSRYEGEKPADRAKYEEADRDRLDAYNRGDWHCVGVVARALIIVDGVRQTIESGGLWGIETDSDESYFAEIGHEELAQLESMLTQLGFQQRYVRREIERATGAPFSAVVNA